MYRHLLVPVDGTDLSTEAVDRAVEFAHTMGARITFFHAQPDYAASFFDTATTMHASAPEEFACAYQGRARELLAKAESAARVRGVPCGSYSTVNDSPYQAIIAAARQAGCDLIFMASHGRRGSLGATIGSQTLKVLMNLEIPVLVSTTPRAPAAVRALGTIRDEHRSLAAVLHAWQYLLKDARGQGRSPDPALMQAMVHYLRTFPVALHHPKEEDYLFRMLRERTSEVNADLDELERQHDRDRQLVAELAGTVERHAGSGATIEEVAQALSAYSAFTWEHLGWEEGVILPAAERHFTEDDWDEIDAAFSENRDPRFGADTDAEYRRLFSRIVNLAPRPPVESPGR